MNDILTKYDIIDTFDDNTFQTVLMGIDIQTMSDIVIINKLKPAIQLDNEFFTLYKRICDNLITLEVNDQETIIINQYKQSQMLTDYLKEEDLSFDARLTLAKSFLLHSVNYDQFDASIKYILINEDQLTVRNNTLYFSNYLFLKKYHADVTMQDVLKSIGEILEIILQLYKEPLTPSSKPLQSLVYKLINKDLKWSVKEIYQEFNTIFSQITSESTNNPISSQETLQVDDIISMSKEKNNNTTVQQLKQNGIELKTDELDDIGNEPISNLTDYDIKTDEMADTEITSHKIDDINESLLLENKTVTKEEYDSKAECDTNTIQKLTDKPGLNGSDDEQKSQIEKPVEGKHHKIILEKKSTNSIQEILDRNVQLHNTLNSEKNKKKYFPTFLLFFIFLIVITFLLILYSSTYA